jgi:hypothetical protein
MLLEGLQEELVISGVGIAAVVYLVVGGVDFGRGKFLPVLKKEVEITKLRSKKFLKISVLASVWKCSHFFFFFHVSIFSI